jgi:ubiquinone/menaquinone biosynthesis C-methylase UbiE
LLFVKKFCVYEDLILADASHLPFKDDSFDYVLCSEVIEHLNKQSGQRLLAEIDRVCKGRAIITTPNISHTRWKYDSPLSYERHQSSWNVGEFKKHSYRVKGLGFKLASMNWVKSPFIWGFFFYIMTPITYLIPTLGEFLIAIKDYVKKKNESSFCHSHL